MKRFEIEVSSMVAKYIKGRTGEMVTASLGDPIGSYLYLMAQSSKVGLCLSEKRQMETEGIVQVQISDFHRTRSTRLFNFAECCTISELWRWHAINEFLGLIKNGYSPSGAMSFFRERYQLTDWDWTEDAMQKTFVRFKAGKNEHAFKPHMIIPLTQ